MQRLFVIVRNPKMRLVLDAQLLLVEEGLTTFEELVVELRELKELVVWSVELEEIVELASALSTVFALSKPVR